MIVVHLPVYANIPMTLHSCSFPVSLFLTLISFLQNDDLLKKMKKKGKPLKKGVTAVQAMCLQWKGEEKIIGELSLFTWLTCQTQINSVIKANINTIFNANISTLCLPPVTISFSYNFCVIVYIFQMISEKA